MFSSGGVEFRVFSQSFDCCLHCHINTMSLFRPPTNFKYKFFFSKFVPISSYVPLMVDHVTRVAIIGVCDQPITTCTSLGKSTRTTFNASTFGMFNASNLRLVGVEVLNVPIITTSLEVPKKKKKPKCDFQQVFKDN